MKCHLLLLVSCIGFGSCLAAPESTPSAAPVTIIVPYAPGGPMDAIARHLTEALGTELSSAVLVENVSGAGGMIGSQKAARAAPDGKTLLMSHIGMAVAPYLYPTFQFNPRTDFDPVALVLVVPLVVVVRTDSPIREAAALQHPPTAAVAASGYSWGTAGPGSLSYLCTTLLTPHVRSQINQIPYRGTGPAMTDLLSGQLDIMCDLATNAKPHIDAGTLRPLAVLGSKRLDSLDKVPSTTELGWKTPDMVAWFGLFIPKGSSVETRKRIEKAVLTVTQSTNFKKHFDGTGAIVPSANEASAARLAQRLNDDLDRWKGLPPAQ